LLPLQQAGSAGIFYSVIGPALTVYFGYRGRLKRRLQL